MSAYPDKFFRESILRISSTLEIEAALHAAYIYLKGHLPLDHLLFMYPDFETNRMRVLATASDEGGLKDGRVWGLPADTMARLRANEVPPIMIVNAPETHFIAKHALELGAHNASLIILRLLVGDALVGSLIFRVAGHHRYTEAHARRLSPLREPFAIALSNALRYQELQRLKNELADDNRYLWSELRDRGGQEIIGADFGLKAVMEQVDQVAPQDSPVLLLGETGTGKELIAGAVHKRSRRSQGPLIKVNCGAITPALLDSELFGHEKGAFTGALCTRRGRFERAQGGTLFLDEVGELTAEAQVRLLRVLQEKEIERVGGSDTIPIDVRIIAATHRDLEALVDRGHFRKDLYYRLLVFPIRLPRLAERKHDIPALVQYFVQKKSRAIGSEDIPLPAPGAVEHLMKYNWPGNVRELENVVERSLILHQQGPLHFDHLFAAKYRQPILSEEAEREDDEKNWDLDTVVRDHIVKALTHTQGRVSGERGAATLLRVNASTLRARMRKLGIPFGCSTPGRPKRHS